jgi:hypothetical protein
MDKLPLANAEENTIQHVAVCFHCDPIENVSMTLFHAMYEHMDAAGLCDDFFEPGGYDDFAPAVPLNGNMTLRERYLAWRVKHGLGEIPYPTRI